MFDENFHDCLLARYGKAERDSAQRLPAPGWAIRPGSAGRTVIPTRFRLSLVHYPVSVRRVTAACDELEESDTAARAGPGGGLPMAGDSLGVTECKFTRDIARNVSRLCFEAWRFYTVSFSPAVIWIWTSRVPSAGCVARRRTIPGSSLARTQM